MAKKSSRLTPEQRRVREELSGLDELREFIPDRDYTDTLIEYASQSIIDEMGSMPAYDREQHAPQSAKRRSMIDRSKALLTYLRNNGYDFNVQADMESGQICAKLANSNISIRLLDSDKNSKYVGRVYNDGASFYFTTKNAYKGEIVEPVITPEMSVDLLRYALGEDVHRVSKVGKEDTVLDELVGTADDNRSYSPHTYMTQNGNSFSTLYSRGKPYRRIDSNGNEAKGIDNVYIKCDASKKLRDDIRFDGSDAAVNAEAFLESSYDAARENFLSELKLEAVDKLARMAADGEFSDTPVFSSDNSFIADTQREYYNKRLQIYTDNETYPDDEAKVNAKFEQDEHIKNEMLDETFGSKALRTINPVMVAAYMGGDKGSLSNENNMLRALKTLQKNGNAYHVVGDGFVENGFREKLISYNDKPVFDDSGKQLYPRDINPSSEGFENLSPFWQQMGKAVYSGLAGTGVNVESIAVDENGIVHYEGNRRIGVKNKGNESFGKVVGDIGQIFEPEAQEFHDDGSPDLTHGLIKTKFNHDDNYYIVPGYTAYVVPPVDENDTRPFEERTRLRGYTQSMAQKIKSTLRHDVISNDNYDNASGLNSVYHHIYGDKKPLDFEETMVQDGKDVGMAKAILETGLRRVRYDNCYKDGTNMLAEVSAEKKRSKQNRGYDIYLDNVRDVMAIMNPETSKGIFDPYATGTATNQGIVRYLTIDAKVNEDGSITRGKETLCPLSAHDDFKYAMFNPPDRLGISFANTITQICTARGRDVNPAGEKIEKIGVGMAHMALGGYTQDDAFVVSKDFADAYMIRDENGELRPLRIGDKICDHSGNKGTISFIADRNLDLSVFDPEPLVEGMTREECEAVERRNYTKDCQKRIIQVFKDNPTLDVIGAPYTAPSRFNGGTAREMIDSQAKAKACGMPTVLHINGEDIEGGIGYCNIVITDKAADIKTHVYDNEDGRTVSGQDIACFAELGADKLVGYLFEHNDSSVIKTREMMISLGLDLSETCEIRRGYQPHQIGYDDNGNALYEERNEFSVKDAFANNKDDKGRLHKKNFREAFAQAFNKEGGFMRLPFPIQLESGDITPEIVDENGKGTGEYRYPVLAAKYRSSRETEDNKLVTHEYTGLYKNICDYAASYLENAERLELARMSNDTEGMKSARSEMDSSIRNAQRASDKLCDDIRNRFFEGKHNIFKQEDMRVRRTNSATAVATADGSLDLNRFGVTASFLEKMGVDPDDTKHFPAFMVGRSPGLSGGANRQMYPEIIEDRPGHPGYNPNDPRIHQFGVSVNPSVMTSFEGDFDGDQLFIYAVYGKEAKKDMVEHISHKAQLLNRECGDRGDHKLYFQDGLDIAAGVYYDAKNGGNVAERMAEAQALANEADKLGDKSVANGSRNARAYEIYNEAMHDATEASFGHDVVCYESPEKHFESLIPMTLSGAKGSVSKLKDYGKYFGADVDFDVTENEDGKVIDAKVIFNQDFEQAQANYEDRRASLAATHAKAYLTGVAGKFSHHALMYAKNGDKDTFSYAAAANALTHPVTQSVLQLKHDSPSDILRKINMIQEVAPALWAGYKIEACTDPTTDKPTWRVVTEKNPETGRAEKVHASPDEWKKMFMDFYTSKSGLNVAKPNPDYIDDMAKILMDKDKYGNAIIRGYDSENPEVSPKEQTLDRLAYEGSFDLLCDYADTKTGNGKAVRLFDGTVNSITAPLSVRKNVEEQEKAAADASYKPNYKALAAKDTQLKPELDAPSVDVVAKQLSMGIEENDIHMAASEPEGKRYAEMDVTERIDTVKSLANKCFEYTRDKKAVPVFTNAERDAYDLVKQQLAVINSFGGDKAAVNAHISENPGCFNEQTMYQAFYDERKRAEAAPVLSKLSETEYAAVARSLVEKYMSNPKGSDLKLTPQEAEFNDRLQEQNKRLSAIQSKAAKDEFVKNHSEDFKERLLCGKIRVEIEKSRKEELQVQAVSESVEKIAETSAPVQTATGKKRSVRSKMENLDEASHIASTVSSVGAEKHREDMGDS